MAVREGEIVEAQALNATWEKDEITEKIIGCAFNVANDLG